MPRYSDWVQPPDVPFDETVDGGALRMVLAFDAASHSPFPYDEPAVVSNPPDSANPDPHILWRTEWRDADTPQSRARYLWLVPFPISFSPDPPPESEWPSGAIGLEYQNGTGVATPATHTVGFSLFAHRGVSYPVGGYTLRETFHGAVVKRVEAAAASAFPPAVFQSADMALMDTLQTFPALPDLADPPPPTAVSTSDELAVSVTTVPGEGLLIVDNEQLAGVLPADPQPDWRSGLIYLGTDANLTAEDFLVDLSGTYSPVPYRFVFRGRGRPLRQRQRVDRITARQQPLRGASVRQDRTWG